MDNFQVSGPVSVFFSWRRSLSSAICSFLESTCPGNKVSVRIIFLLGLGLGFKGKCLSVRCRVSVRLQGYLGQKTQELKIRTGCIQMRVSCSTGRPRTKDRAALTHQVTSGGGDMPLARRQRARRSAPSAASLRTWNGYASQGHILAFS